MKAKYTSQLLLSWLVIAFTVMAAATNARAQSAGGQVLQSSVAERKPIQKSIALDQYLPREPSIGLPQRFETRGGIDPNATSHLSKGETEYRAGRHAAAVPELKQAVKESPGSYDSHYLLALSLTATGKLREAIEEFKKAIELATKDDAKIVAYYNMANAYFDLAEYADAASAYQRAIKLNNKLSKPHYNLGLAYVGLNKLADATDEFKQATELKADYAEAHYNLGVAYFQLRSKSDAENQLTILAQLKPELANKLAALIQGHGP